MQLEIVCYVIAFCRFCQFLDADDDDQPGDNPKKRRLGVFIVLLF